MRLAPFAIALVAGGRETEDLRGAVTVEIGHRVVPHRVDAGTIVELQAHFARDVPHRAAIEHFQDAVKRRELIASKYGDHRPCSTLVFVAGLAAPEYKVEVEAWASKVG